MCSEFRSWVCFKECYSKRSSQMRECVEICTNYIYNSKQWWPNRMAEVDLLKFLKSCIMIKLIKDMWQGFCMLNFLWQRNSNFGSSSRLTYLVGHQQGVMCFYLSDTTCCFATFLLLKGIQTYTVIFLRWLKKKKI